MTATPDHLTGPHRSPLTAMPRGLGPLVTAAMAGTALAVGAFLLWLTYQDRYAGFVWDDAYYLLMADRWSPYTGPTPAILAELVGTRNFPPLYPLLLAWTGAGSAAIGRAQLVTGGCALVALLLFYRWLRALGLQPVTCWVAALATALAPVTLMHLPVLWSEHLYLALSLGALVAVARTGDRPGGRLLGALLIALAALTRVAGLALVVAYIAYALWTWRRRGLLPALLAALPFLAERTINTLSNRSGTDYQSAGWGFIRSQEALDLITRQLTSLYTAWERVLAMEPSTLAAGCAALLLVPLAAGLAARVRNGQLDGFYVICYSALLLSFWDLPQQGPRLIYGVYPVLIGQMLIGAKRLLPNRTHAATALALLLFATLTVPAVNRIAARMAEPAPPGLDPYRHTRAWQSADNLREAEDIVAARAQFVQDAKVIGATVPVADCVLTEFPPLVMLYAKRRAVLPPWQDLTQAAAIPPACSFYYLIPIMLNEPLTPQHMARLQAQWDLLYQSASPRDRSGTERLGILLRRKPTGP